MLKNVKIVLIKVKMKNFADYKNEKILKEDDASAAPYQQSSWLGTAEKPSYSPMQNKNKLSNQDNPVVRSYHNLSKALDDFTNEIQRHPVGKNQKQFLQGLTTFRNNLSREGADLSLQMKQYNQQNAVQNASSSGSNGTPLQNAGSGPNPVSGQPKQLHQDDVVQHLKDRGFGNKDIQYYLNKRKTSQLPSSGNTV